MAVQEQPPASHSAKQRTGLGVEQGAPASVNSMQMSGSEASSPPSVVASAPPSPPDAPLPLQAHGSARAKARAKLEPSPR